jgi:hypothetical protein
MGIYQSNLFLSGGCDKGALYLPIFFFCVLKHSLHFLRKGKEMASWWVLIKFAKVHQAFSHLLFADDSLILICATEGDCRNLQTILQLYEDCSGQAINKAKLAILFS